MSFLWEKLVRPALFRMDAESAHERGVAALRSGLGGMFAGSDAARDRPSLAVSRFGLEFRNPLGLAAGFDKNAIVVNELAGLGFGFVEVGTVTYGPQPGNDKPRLFRLPADQALINRLGFNNDGAKAVTARLAQLKRKCVVGVNIGKNKAVANEDAVENYLKTFDLIHPHADYIAVNVSSPNTPNLRELQKGENLDHLLSALQARNTELGKKPILVKIAPDLTDPEIISAAESCMSHEIDGIIATNTTISRDGLRTADVGSLGAGGVSGRPLMERSTNVIRVIYRRLGGKMPIVGVGGIFTAADAFEKIAAGACLVQAYTGFVYGGPRFAVDILDGLEAMLSERGFKSVDEAVGSEDLQAQIV
jgi:dihydroorotate dehydrogenase